MSLIIQKFNYFHFPILSGTKSFSLITIILVFIILNGQTRPGSALRCYQGTQSYQLQVSGSPTECGYTAFTCIKVVDYSQGTTTRSCQTVNCTIGGTMTMTTSPVCQNTSGYPTQTFCCCYGDGCNSALGNKIKKSLGGLIIFSIIQI
ncbi:hypothetical protein Mgra_00001175 [Meloidogyne graminicola]|uniref:Uncharacterized protein n=1 Tax=Meloidogyne graminicola TaxID=189291 RepID=A0A8T0A0V4_9BILA|nr:hypothetical protein Mgra_00001175 [Meloidogyne graminicola]